MAAVLAVCSAVCAAFATGLLVDAVGRLRPGRASVKRDLRVAQRLLAVAELLGHGRAGRAVFGLPGAAALAEKLRGLLAAHGIAATPQGTLAVLCMVSLAACLTGVLVSTSLLGGAVGLAAIGALVSAALGSQTRKDRNALAAQMPDVLRSLSGALGAGKSLSQAIEHVGRTLGEPMGPQFLQASFEIASGRSVEEAVEGLCQRIDAPGIALLGTALQISQRTGSSLNDLFAQTAQMASDSVALRRELEVKTSQVRLSAKVVAAMPVVLCGALTLLSSDYRAGLSLQAGKTCLVVAALLDLSALLLVRRVMSRSLK